MKILLIQPPVRDFYQTAIRTQPIGLAYLAASLEQHAFDVEILDCQVTSQKKSIPLPEPFSFIKKFYPGGDLSPFRLFGNFYHFGLSYEEIARRISSSAADAVGVSAQFTPYCTEALQVAALVKSMLPKVPVIMGGAHVAAAPLDVLRQSSVDYVVLGEAEESLPLLLQHIQSGRIPEQLDGVGYKLNGALRINPRRRFINEIDTLPFPARQRLELSLYTIGKQPYTVLITSRGCPQRCTYCSVSQVMGETFRTRSPENILEEVKQCREIFGISVFDIEDDNFTLDQKRAEHLLHLFIEEFGEDELQLRAMNGVSIFSLNKELIAAMKRAGFHHLDLSLGSISRRVSIEINRPHDPAQATSVLLQAAEHGLPTITYVILGIPGHTLDEMLQSLFYLMGQKTLIGPSIFYPTPGTAVYEQLYGSGRRPRADYKMLRSSLFPVETEEFSQRDLITLLKLSRWINFVKRSLLPEICRQTILVPELHEIAARVWMPDELKEMPGTATSLSRPEPLTVRDVGKIATALFLATHDLFSVRRLRQPRAALYHYRMEPYPASRRVLNLFWDAVDGVPICSVPAP